MKIHFSFLILAISALSPLNCTAQTLALPPSLLTHGEIERSLNISDSRIAPKAGHLSQNAEYHVSQAKSLLKEIDQLKVDGRSRGANIPFKKVMYHLASARAAGSGINASLGKIYGNSGLAPSLIKLRWMSLANAVKIGDSFGLFTPENLQQLKGGYAPVVTKGRPIYIGETIEIDHKIPMRGANGHPHYENEVANLQPLPKSINRDKRDLFISSAKDHKKILDKAYADNRNLSRSAYVGAALSTATGIFLLYSSGNSFLAEVQSGPLDNVRLLQLSERGALAIAGVGYTASGLSHFASRSAVAAATTINFAQISQICAKVGFVTIILAEGIGIGIDVYNWNSMTEQRRYIAIVRHGVNIAGLAGGFAVGAMAGSAFGPPGAIIGGFVVAGATYAAAQAATGAINDFYAHLDEEQKKQVRNFLYQLYGLGESSP